MIMADPSNILTIRTEPQVPSLHGCSLLFDNPGQSLFSAGDLLFIDNGADTDSTLALYRVLYDTVAPREKDHPINRYLLHPKPAAYYHVTVWGGSTTATWRVWSNRIAHGCGTGLRVFLTHYGNRAYTRALS